MVNPLEAGNGRSDLARASGAQFDRIDRFRHTLTIAATDADFGAATYIGLRTAALRLVCHRTDRTAAQSVMMALLNSHGEYTRIADAKRVRTWVESQSRVTVL